MDPIKQTEADHNDTRGFLLSALKGVMKSFRHAGIAWMGFGILTVSLIASVMGLSSFKGRDPAQAGDGKGQPGRPFHTREALRLR